MAENLLGTWPGDETEKELLDGLKELRKMTDKKAVEQCNHPAWYVSVMPWGRCKECGLSIQQYLPDLLERIKAKLPQDDPIVKEISTLFYPIDRGEATPNVP